MNRQAEITVETGPLNFNGRRPKGLRGWCEGCRARVRMATVFQAALAVDVNARTIFRWAETGEIHSSVSPDNNLLICFTSLYLREICTSSLAFRASPD